MLQKLLSSACMFVWVLGLQAQERDETPVIDINKTPIVTPAPKKSLADKIDLNLTAGSTFMYSKGFGNGLSNYIAPELSYKVAPKIRLNVGLMVVSSNFAYNKYLGFHPEQSVVFRTKPRISTLAYVSGDYLVNDRLTISGMVIRDLSNPGYNSYSPSIQGMSLRMDYKLTNNISIGAGMHMSQGDQWISPNYGLLPATNFNPLFNY